MGLVYIKHPNTYVSVIQRHIPVIIDVFLKLFCCLYTNNLNIILNKCLQKKTLQLFMF